MDIDVYKYVPILALQPAEMAALEELPEKDKDFILPLISLKGWVGSKTLEKSIDRIKKSIDERFCIVDIDSDFLSENKDIVTGEYPGRDVFKQLEELRNPNDGYKKWTDFIEGNKSFIPVLQLDDMSEFNGQVDNLQRIGRFFVVRVPLGKGKRVSNEDLGFIIRKLISKGIANTLFIFDFGDIGRENLLERHQYAELVERVYSYFPQAVFSVSGTSFPYSFAGSYRGELPIYERQIYDYVERKNSEIRMIYSDRGSARAGKMGGGSGAVPVRLDYPLKHDWRFVRKGLEEGREKEDLYQEAALEMMKSEYWDQEVRLWGKQMIERTSLKDPYGITSPSKATAARINMHLFQQLHYNDSPEDIDTEEDWED